MAIGDLKSNILTKCSPVKEVKGLGIKRGYVIDPSIVIDLEIVNYDKGLVSCPLYENGLCRGKERCIVNDLDADTTVVAGAERK